jgi:nucleoside-diphosphate-sugar epimerase
MSKAVYLAADKAGVRRLIVLSSASIYNQNPTSGTTEESPLPEKPATPYNANKIASDKIFRQLRSNGKTEIIFLMPGIVYGPRSQWIARVTNQIMEGTAYLIRGGEGICNAVYVDNLVEAVRLSLTAPGVDTESFFVSDSETVTWADFYRPVLSAFGATFEDVHFINDPPVFNVSVRERMRQRVQEVAETRTILRVKPFVPPQLKKIYKTALHLALPSNDVVPDSWAPPEQKRPNVTLEMSLLQQCAYKLPNAKAERVLRYYPTVSFAEGISKSVKWLEFAGYLSSSEQQLPEGNYSYSTNRAS